MALNVDSLPGEPEQFQSYLDELKIEELAPLEEGLVGRFSEVRDSEGPVDDDKMTHLRTLTSQIESVRSERGRRTTAAAQERAKQATVAQNAALAELDSLVAGNAVSKADSQTETAASEQLNGLATVLAQAMSLAVPQVQQAVVASSGTPGLNKHLLNLSSAQQFAPDPKLQPSRREAVLVASADIPGHARNGSVEGINGLVDLVGARARMLSLTRGTPNYVNVAYLKRDHRFRLSLDSNPAEIDQVLTAATDTGALVAAGGWCAPSEISYDFFNIVCEDGMIDLPTVGVLNRGGFRWPTSPSIADVFADADATWSWTEQQDIDAVDSDSDLKTCSRVPCSDFEEVRAACDGLCITAGNLTDFAYPEMIANYLRLVMAARAHRTNQQIIAGLVADSTAVTMGDTGQGAAASILNAAELQAVDYRERYRMCEDAIVEAVFPRWALAAVRADLANRTGVENFMSVTNQQIAAWFDARNIRVQFVADWQAGFAGSPIGSPAAIPTAWPTSVQFMLYAPGTFVRGQGLQLDLGVVRDSTLNERNDHTAAWMEDCYAVAMVGHTSRVVTTEINTLGVTGAAVLGAELS